MTVQWSKITPKKIRHVNLHKLHKALGADMNLPDLCQRHKNLWGGWGVCSAWKFWKIESLISFPVSWSGFLWIEQVVNEMKILGILIKQNLNGKIARLLSKNCLTNQYFWRKNWNQTQFALLSFECKWISTYLNGQIWGVWFYAFLDELRERLQ